MKPSDLLLGLRELFGALIPGTIFLYCMPIWILDQLGALVATGRGAWAGEAVELLVFFSAAYATGTLLSGFGSSLDYVTDKWVWRPGLGSRGDYSVRSRNIEALALDLRDHALLNLPVAFEIPIWGKRAFWWNYLRVHCPQGVVEIDRLEAQQKLFRSLVGAFSVLAILEVVGLATPTLEGSIDRLVILCIGAVTSFLPYWKMREKLTDRLFQLAVVQFVSAQLHQRDSIGSGIDELG